MGIPGAPAGFSLTDKTIVMYLDSFKPNVIEAGLMALVVGKMVLTIQDEKEKLAVGMIGAPAASQYFSVMKRIQAKQMQEEAVKKRAKRRIEKGTQAPTIVLQGGQDEPITPVEDWWRKQLRSTERN